MAILKASGLSMVVFSLHWFYAEYSSGFAGRTELYVFWKLLIFYGQN